MIRLLISNSALDTTCACVVRFPRLNPSIASSAILGDIFLEELSACPTSFLRPKKRGKRVLESLFVPRQRRPDSTPRPPEPTPQGRLTPQTMSHLPECQRRFTPVAALADLPSTRRPAGARLRSEQPSGQIPGGCPSPSPRYCCAKSPGCRCPCSNPLPKQGGVREQAELSPGRLYSAQNLFRLCTTPAVPPRHIPVSPWTATTPAAIPGDCPKQMDLLHLKQKQYNLFYAEKPVGTIRAKDGSKRRLSAPDCQRMEVCLE